MSTTTKTTLQPTSWGILAPQPAAASSSTTSSTSTNLGGSAAGPAKGGPSSTLAANGMTAAGAGGGSSTTPLWQPPVYASAGGNTFIPGDAVDLNEIFSDDFLIPGMGMLPYEGEDGGFAGSEEDLMGGLAPTSTDGDSEAGASAGEQGQPNVALAMMTGGVGGKAAAVVQQAAARTRSGITTRLGGARLQAVQAAAAAAAANQPLARLSPGSGRQLSKRQQAQAAEEEEDDEDDYDSEDEEDGEGGAEDGSGTGGLRRRKKAKLTMKPLTEQQRVERRERNREHAKRSRMRKKFMLESLQAQMQALRKENLRLRQLVATKIPEKAETILRGCSSVKSQNMMSTVELGHHRALADSDGKLISALQFSQQNFTVSDPSLPDNPIVYASQGFLDLTGYTADQIIGRNCRFLQGPGTDPAAVDIIRRGVALGEDTSVCLLNYRADGTPFWNQFFVAALRDSDGAIVNYVGVQCKVDEAPIEEELKERVKTINFDEA